MGLYYREMTLDDFCGKSAKIGKWVGVAISLTSLFHGYTWGLIIFIPLFALVGWLVGSFIGLIAYGIYKCLPAKYRKKKLVSSGESFGKPMSNEAATEMALRIMNPKDFDD